MMTWVKIGLAVAVAVGAVAMVKGYINEKAKYAELQVEIKNLRADYAVVLHDGDQYRELAESTQVVVDSLEAEVVAIRVVNRELVLEGREKDSMLEVARAAVDSADSLLVAARAGVDETQLPEPVFKLVLAERRFGEAAKAEAEACDATLGNCREQVDNLQGQVGLLDHEIQLLGTQILQADTLIQGLEAFNVRQDSTITELNKQLKPSIWKQFGKKAPALGLGVLIGIAAMAIAGG